MSVDLVGSTAFKANKDYAEPRDGNRIPGWVDEFRTFYKEFPLEVSRFFELNQKSYDDDFHTNVSEYPRVWKTIGDEIIFCGRVRNIKHTAACVSAFLKALEAYSKRLEDDKKPLKLKGTGWLAAFPAPNISIAIISTQYSGEKDETKKLSENEEAFEAQADEQPDRFDFLGKGIDTGFRIAKNASEDKFIISVQLGYILAQAACKRQFSYSFGYHGREILKGVIDGSPYPVISVDTERSEIKSRLKSREAALSGELSINPHALCSFLEAFMEAVNIEMPCLSENRDGWKDDFPKSYQQYKIHYQEQLATDDRNTKQAEENKEPAKPDDSLLNEASSFLEKFTNSSRNESSDNSTEHGEKTKDDWVI